MRAQTVAMSEVPKIVYDRLRAAAPSGAHPDTDVLAAFAEQALSIAEREGVIQHLALCPDCREVVALSLPPSEAVAQPEAAGERVAAAPVLAGKAGAGLRNWFAWPSLRWAALAAGVVVAGAILLVRPGKPNQPLQANLPTEKTASGATDAKLAKQAVPALTEFAATRNEENKPTQKTLQATRDKESGVADLRQAPTARPLVGLIAKESAAAKVPAPQFGVAGGVVGARVLKAAPAGDQRKFDALATEDTLATKKDEAVGKGAGAGVGGARGVATATASTPSAAPPRPLAVPSMSETVTVTGVAEAATVETARTDTRAFKTEPPSTISKAKPARVGADQPTTVETSTSMVESAIKAEPVANLAVNGRVVLDLQKVIVQPQWKLSSGSLQRSLDQGATWQTTTLRSRRPLLCYASLGADVWAGGKAGTLFHSADGGATWNQVRPAINDQRLRANIIRIEIRGPTEIAVSTRENESWTTVDGGKTWEKK
jgi:hypothetical protein